MRHIMHAVARTSCWRPNVRALQGCKGQAGLPRFASAVAQARKHGQDVEMAAQLATKGAELEQKSVENDR